MIISNRLKYLLLLISLLSISLANADESSWSLVQGGTWTPSDQILSKIKTHLEPYMKSQEKVFGRSLKKWNTYRFQYQGQEEKGNKFVYINAFCNIHGPKGINVRKDFVFVHDGGGCFFQLKYDPIADKFFDAFINGEA
jgi:hypothetical protein